MKSRLRFYKQETPYSCVPACLRIVLSGLGLDLDEAELRSRCDCTPLGTEALKAVDAVRQLGLTKTVKLTLTAEELSNLVNGGAAPIVFVNLLPIDGVKVGHAVVVIGIEVEGISVYDPLQGERLLSCSTFGTAWAMMHNLTIVVQD
jgi:ABC-type bacteriocin/lantibiotic exporter with double-glycine peptidase domain